MRKLKRRLLWAAIGILSVLMCVTPAYAKELKFPSAMLIGDMDGLHIDENGQYFIYAKDLRPGDTITKTLLIRNLGTDEVFHLTMTAEPLFAVGPVDLLNAVHLKLVLNGRQIYSGRLRGDEGINMINNALQLGDYGPGDNSTLEITMTVDKSMKVSYTKSVAEIKWIFVAVQEKGSGGGGGGGPGPQTGDIAGYVLYFAFLGSMLAVITLLLVRIRQEKRANRLKP